MRIYKTTNKINGKIYVGKDVNHGPDYLGSGFLLHKAIEKYGRENFINETIEECSTLEQLNEREIFWIKELNSTDRKIGYNIAKGGTGGDTTTHLSDEAKKCRVEKWKRSVRSSYDDPLWKEEQSKKIKEIWQREGHKEKVQASLIGRNIQWKGKISDSIREWHKTHKINYTDEMRQRTSERMKGIEFVSISSDVEELAVEMYKTYGLKILSRKLKELGHDVSPYILRRIMTKRGIYQPWRKGKRS